MASILVLGLGNTLLQDEGLGVQAAHRLQETAHLPDEVLVLDGGTLGLDLLPYFNDATHVLILDAVEMNAAPGTPVRLEGQQIPAALAAKLSMHQVGLQDLLAACSFRGRVPEKLVLLGLQPAMVDWGLELTTPIATALPGLVQSAITELEAWGVQTGQGSSSGGMTGR